MISLIFSFQNYYLGFKKKLKAAGRGDPKHNEEIPKSSLVKIMDLLKKLQATFRAAKNFGKDSAEYKKLVAELPDGYQDRYHFLLQYAAGYLLLSLFARRGREGIDTLTKKHFEKVFDEEENYSYWAKTKGELSKNQR